MIQILPVKEIKEVGPGDDLAKVISDGISGCGLLAQLHDIVVVTQKIVSKAEGQFVDLDEVTPSCEACELAQQTRKDPRLVEVILRESTSIIRAVPHVLITRHRSGHVMANAGVDQSNLGPSRSSSVLLLPADPDRTAGALSAAFSTLFGFPVPVVISDSFGRPWRMGVVNVAIGASGLPSLIDRRGETDRDGRPLEVTQVAFADLIASAAGLATGEAGESIPAALVRGASWSSDDPVNPAAQVIRPIEQDLFR